MSEDVCLDCIEGDHESCRREAGYLHQDTPERCGCWATGHRLDNRGTYLRARPRPDEWKDDLMETLEWRDAQLDRSRWGSGPWNDEPDKAQWPDPATGLPCLLHRNRMGALCGYVAVPEGHPWHSKGYDDVDADVHGGLTFADECQPTERPEHGICHIPGQGEHDNVWWVGFDCAHSGDLVPSMVHDYATVGMSPPDFMGDDIYRDVAYVKAECAFLAQQAVAAAK